MSKIDLYKGDCLEVMDELIAKGVVVDVIIADIPYQTTACAWDTLIPFNNHIIVKKGKKEIPMYEDEWVLQQGYSSYKSVNQLRDEFKEISKEGMWQKLNKLIKDNGAIVLTSQGVFTAKLILSNEKLFKYKIVWEKSKSTNFLNAKKQPLRKHEDICVFYKKQPLYNPQMSEGEAYNKGFRKNQLTGSYGDFKSVEVKSNGERYPTDIVYFKTAESEGEVFHPTQKPVALMKYIIKTYTNKGESILDFTMGSGTTGVAVAELNKEEDLDLSFCGIELDEKYFNIAEERINTTLEGDK